MRSGCPCLEHRASRKGAGESQLYESKEGVQFWVAHNGLKEGPKYVQEISPRWFLLAE
jgi:hypothetical protein